MSNEFQLNWRAHWERVKNLRTPLYVYDKQLIRNRARTFVQNKSKNGRVFFALKANNSPEVIRLLWSEGVGIDVVSQGEMQRALAQGVPARQMVFSGVGKSRDEIEFALNNDVLQINVESWPELRRVAEVARGLNVVAPIAIRLNPNVSADTHPYIQTGFRENKFGVIEAQAEEMISFIREQTQLRLQCLAIHIGSQIFSLDTFVEAIKKVGALYTRWQRVLPTLRALDVGGGLGVNYQRHSEIEDLSWIREYLVRVSEVVAPLDLDEVFFEPGRSLVARAGFLLAQVEYVKRTPFKNFLIVNTGMHHLMRPALYQAEHRIQALTCRGQLIGEEQNELDVFDVVGPICESTDVLGKNRQLPKDLSEGDYVVICDVGAYGQTMANNYNLQAPVGELFIEEKY